MVTCYIGLGSNLGDRQYYLACAIKKIKMLPLTRVIKVSSTIETKPEGGPPQGPYFNSVLSIDTELAPYQLLLELQEIETSLGRIRTVIDGPRTIDLDILTYGDCCITEEALCIPHQRIKQRQFVLVPLKEIAPEVVKRLFRKSHRSQVTSHKFELKAKTREKTVKKVNKKKQKKN